MTAKGLMRAAGAVLLSLVAAGGAAAQGACGEHAMIVDLLAERYGEVRQSIALSADNAVVEIFASADTGTWTMTLTRPGGPTCLVAAGHAFEHVPQVPGAAGEGA